ncbi:hypothetical protein Clacol_008745 [Clathrus columnatus]|uniref:Uncharacterized protein n=1 Tax=Clathrus columnatus TaxID=1419009 RepID=A0AAV5AQ19_9AGAM|nr:hypothetical protein Clacol_008745 [Clathrus columnatus]
MTSPGRINDMAYTSLLPSSSFVQPIPIRRIIPPGKPPMDGIILPPLLTIRQDSGLTSTTTKACVYQPFTFYSFGSVPVDVTEYERMISEKKKGVRERMLVDYTAVLQEWANGVNHGLKDSCENVEKYDSICATQKRVMWNSVNRIVRNNLESDAADLNRERLTLFLAHPIGYPKETWELTIRSLLVQLEGSNSNDNDSTPIVEEIWVFEAVQHGDTGLINVGLLPCAYDWLDNLSETHLEDHQFDPKIHPVQVHPTGAARSAPSGRTESQETELVEIKVRLSMPHLTKTKLGHEREEAYKALSKSPFFKAWDPDVLAAYVQYGIVEEAGVAKLKMSGLHEAIVFLHASAIGELWQLLPQLDSHISLFFVVSSLDRIAFGNLDAVRETVWRRPDNVSNAVLPVGHLIQFQAPVELVSFDRITATGL